MAYRIAGQSIETQRSLSPDDLREAFETAVCAIHNADPAHKKPQPGVPIAPRSKISGTSQSATEKRALSDAARALAQLWKV
jgi:hypothetical protein